MYHKNLEINFPKGRKEKVSKLLKEKKTKQLSFVADLKMILGTKTKHSVVSRDSLKLSPTRLFENSIVIRN